MYAHRLRAEAHVREQEKYEQRPTGETKAEALIAALSLQEGEAEHEETFEAEAESAEQGAVATAASSAEERRKRQRASKRPKQRRRKQEESALARASAREQGTERANGIQGNCDSGSGCGTRKKRRALGTRKVTQALADKETKLFVELATVAGESEKMSWVKLSDRNQETSTHLCIAVGAVDVLACRARRTAG